MVWFSDTDVLAVFIKPGFFSALHWTPWSFVQTHRFCWFAFSLNAEGPLHVPDVKQWYIKVQGDIFTETFVHQGSVKGSLCVQKDARTLPRGAGVMPGVSEDTDEILVRHFWESAQHPPAFSKSLWSKHFHRAGFRQPWAPQLTVSWVPSGLREEGLQPLLGSAFLELVAFCRVDVH